MTLRSLASRCSRGVGTERGMQKTSGRVLAAVPSWAGHSALLNTLCPLLKTGAHHSHALGCGKIKGITHGKCLAQSLGWMNRRSCSSLSVSHHATPSLLPSTVSPGCLLPTAWCSLDLVREGRVRNLPSGSILPHFSCPRRRDRSAVVSVFGPFSFNVLGTHDAFQPESSSSVLGKFTLLFI